MSPSAIAREHSHPGAGVYIKIAFILAVITAVEVLTFYMPEFQPILVEILLVLSAAKFLLVAMFFMHLKFDHTSFAVYFGGGILLAMCIFLGVMFLAIGSHGWPGGY
ncbi:MAG: cytochrome C oxidase subunit IV family protein [Chloroflexi bacterium]|nr:cytochrome C oxidase subunit IV family protein [Chloroflexota bacterium]